LFGNLKLGEEPYFFSVHQGLQNLNPASSSWWNFKKLHWLFTAGREKPDHDNKRLVGAGTSFINGSLNI